jgi:hypothetical protein
MSLLTHPPIVVKSFIYLYGTSLQWLLQVNDLINLARDTVGRNFSADERKLYFPGAKNDPKSASERFR